MKKDHQNKCGTYANSVNPDILSSLKTEYGLKDNHLKIINALLDKQMDAKHLSQAANIPMGRIYDFVNELLANKLILRELQNKKYVYYTGDIKERIKEFMDLQILSSIEKKGKLNTLLNKNNKNIRVKVITNPIEYYTEMIASDNVTSSYSWTYLNIFLPEIFYPTNTQQGMKIAFRWFKKYEPLWSYPLTEQMIDAIPNRRFKDLLMRKVPIRLLLEKNSLGRPINTMKSHVYPHL